MKTVSASDLYDLVDMNSKDKDRFATSAKIADIEEGLRLFEGLHWAVPRKREKEGPRLKRLGHSFSQDKSMKPLSGGLDNSDLVISKVVKNAASSKKVRDKQQHKEVYFLDERNSNIQNAAKRSERGLPKIRRTPIDVFLQQALSGASNSSVQLKVRPKRAKRMQLHQSQLLAIPEDAGTFIRPDRSSPEHHGKDFAKQTPHSDWSTSVVDKYTDKKHLPSKSLADDLKKSPLKPKEIRDRETRTPNIPGLSELVIPSIYPPMPSIYPPLPGAAEWSRGVHIKQMSQEKTSPRDRNNKKTKRLIFLRDQPEKNYRREV